MKVTSLAVAGAALLDLERHEDERGWFARSFCEEELRRAGIEFHVHQANVSWNKGRGTLRGMHFQRPASGESKIVRCVRGAVHDVVIDLRESSPTYLAWDAALLSGENGRAVYVPDGCAHGFLTLEDDSEVHYLMGGPYLPGVGAGVRYDDPAFSVRWPEPVRVISDRDRTYPDFEVRRPAGPGEAP